MKRKGFTLIEILIASAILFILFEVGYHFYTSNFKYLKEEKDKAYIEAEAKSFMDFTNQSFKMAFQNKIDAVDTNGDTIYDEIQMELPLNDTQLIYEADNKKNLTIKRDGNSIKIIQQKTENAIAALPEEKEILSGKINLFEIKKENNFIEINFKVNYNKGIEREYSIKYNIREWGV